LYAKETNPKLALDAISLSVHVLTVFHSIHFQTTTFSDTTKSLHTATNYYAEPYAPREKAREIERSEKVKQLAS